MAKCAWIAGANGLIGENLTKLLSETSEYEHIYRLVRKPKLDGSESSGRIVDVAVDYESLSMNAKPNDDYFCCLGTTIKKAGSQDAFRLVDEKYVIRFAEEAKKNQARCLVIISSLGADARSRAFYLRVKGQMEDSIRRKSLRSVYVLRPSLLLGERNEHRPNEKFASMIAPFMSALMIGSFSKFKPIEARRVAELVLQSASKGAEGFHVMEDLK